MKTTLFPFLLLSSIFFVLVKPNIANQANSFRKTNKFRSSSWFHEKSELRTSEFDLSKIVIPHSIGPQDGLMEADKIETLPGQPNGVDFNQYAGYVTVNETSGKAFFYYFVESPQNSSSKPLVLWLNGGPGCSSLGYGAMQELGPFRVNSDGKTLSRNAYAWNNLANILFLESPVGVGYSYSNSSEDYNHYGDMITAHDSYAFLLNWFERFSSYKNRDFYISGESYAGHYIPQLATIILQNKNSTINLEGIAIGNPYIDDRMNAKGQDEFFWTHGIISDEIYNNITKSCNYSAPSPSLACMQAGDAVNPGNIDWYNRYAPICLTAPNGSLSSSEKMAKIDPCSEHYVQTYLNDPAVQKALHARQTNWTSCIPLGYFLDAPLSMVPDIKCLIDSGINVWLYSGDIDDIVPFVATKYSVNSIGMNVTTPWRPWYSNSEVGGYVRGYKGLTFATVRGAGHMVPRDQQERAFTMFSSFLLGQLPPSNA